MTLAFAFMAQELFFNQPSISGVEGSVVVPRPPGAEGDAAFYYLVLVVLAACALAGRQSAHRADRAGAGARCATARRPRRALGINVVKYKTIIFGLSAFMAAVGGILRA